MSKVAPADASQFGYVDSEPCENPLWCAFTAVTDCVFPCAMFCCCPCKLLKNVPKEGPFTYHHLADATWQPYKILLCNRMQSWLIRHPMSEAYCCCCIRPCITIHDVAAYGTSMIKSFRKECGPVWCDNLKVEVADEELAKLIMMNPQDGGPALGQAWLREHKLPHMRSDNSRLFLIDMANDMANDHADASDAAAHTGKMTTLKQESVRHAQIRGSIFKYLINAETEKRQSTSDPVIQRLYANLRKEVHSGRSSSEWGESKAGLAGFILRYLHYALFALDLTDEQFEQLWLLYYTPGPGLGAAAIILQVQRYIGYVFESLLGDKNMKALPELRAYARKLYASSPPLANYSEAIPLDDFLEGWITVLGLAGLQGPKGGAAHILMNYKGYIPGKRFEPPTGYDWKYGDRAKVRLAVLEAMRMQPAVFGSGLSTPRPIRCPVGEGRTPVVFPRNTPMHVNYVALNWDPAIWGDNVGKFDPETHADKLWDESGSREGVPYPNFNSWGGGMGALTTGRECPGKNLSLTMLVDMVELVLKPDAPSAPPSPPPSPAQIMERD